MLPVIRMRQCLQQEAAMVRNVYRALRRGFIYRYLNERFDR